MLPTNGISDRLRTLYVRLAAVAFLATTTVASGQGIVITPIGSGTKSDRASTATFLPSGSLFVAGQSQGAISTIHAAATYPLAPTIGTPATRTTFYYPDNTTDNSDFATSSVAVGANVVTAGVAYTRNNGCPAKFVGNFAITWWNEAGAYRKVETVFNPDKKGKPTTKSKAVKLLVAPDGSLVALGEDVYNGSRLAFARYNSATGALLTKKLHGLEFQPRGGAILGNSVLVVGKLLTTNRMAVVRLDLNGNLDNGWGTGGIREYAIGSESQAEAAAIDAFGKIVIAGSAVFGDREAIVARLNPDASPDLTFHGVGYVSTDLGGTEDSYTAVNIRANGLIVATGSMSLYDGIYLKGSFAASQYLADGSLDAANFGDGGISIIPIRESALCYDAKIQQDGRLVMVGEVRTIVQESPRRTNMDFGAVQLDLNGRP